MRVTERTLYVNNLTIFNWLENEHPICEEAMTEYGFDPLECGQAHTWNHYPCYATVLPPPSIRVS